MSYPTAVAYYDLGLNRVTRLEKGWTESPDISYGRMLHRFRMNTLFTPLAELQEKWDIVKSNYPWFYIMRELVGDYLENVVGATLQDGSRSKRKDATPDERRGHRRR